MGAINNYRGSIPQAYNPEYSKHYPVEYFSGCDVSLFFGHEYIDEMTGFEFSVQEMAQPIYSYASYVPETIIHGARLVRGSFAVNMRSGDYLQDMLRTDVKRALGTSLPDSILTHATTSAAATAAAPDPNSDPDTFKNWVQTQKTVFWKQVTNASSKNTSVSTQPYFVNGGFTILLIYGNVDPHDLRRHSGRIRTIENVHIFSTGQSIGLDGQNIMETYSFIATDINKTIREGSLS